MVPAAEVRVDECYELPDDGSIGLIKRRNLMVKAIDAVLASLRLTLSRNFLIAQRFISGCVPEIRQLVLSNRISPLIRQDEAPSKTHETDEVAKRASLVSE
jgi:hypothetical protein